MIRKRSFDFIAAAQFSGAAFDPVLGQTAPFGATSWPLDVLNDAKAWLTPVPGGDPQALRGKVVIVNFWTYSCINSLRPLPYLRAWSERNADRGLVVVGVHRRS